MQGYVLFPFLFLLFFLPYELWAKGKEMDSLNAVLQRGGLTQEEEINTRIELSKHLMSYDLGEALIQGLEAMVSAEESGVLETHYKAVFQVASVFFYNGMEENAAVYWLKSLYLADLLGDSYEIARVNFNLSALYIGIEEYEKAQIFLDAAKKYFETEKGFARGGKVALLHIINNQAIISKKLNKEEEALRLFEEGLFMAREFTEKSFLNTIINSYASFLIETQSYEKAKDLIEELLETNKVIPNLQLEATAYLKLARIFNKLENKEKEEFYLQKGYPLAVEVGSLTLQQEFAKDLYVHAKESGRLLEALTYQEIVDSLNRIANREEAKRALFLKEIQQLQNDFEFRLKEQGKAYYQQRLILLVSIGLLLILFILYYFYVYKSKRERQLKWMQLVLARKRLELQNTALQNEIEKKDKELAINTLKEIQRNEVLKNLTGELQKAQRAGQDIHWGMDVKKKMAHLENDRVWEDFDLRFSEIGGDFYQRLMEQFPDLTVNERRLCAFLRLDMNTKEIVAITGQSIRAVEVARTRLRKKLNLAHNDTALNTFLINY
jgi:hypothetical protein